VVVYCKHDKQIIGRHLGLVATQQSRKEPFSSNLRNVYNNIKLDV
jgi:hypothetical protein